LLTFIAVMAASSKMFKMRFIDLQYSIFKTNGNKNLQPAIPKKPIWLSQVEFLTFTSQTNIK